MGREPSSAWLLGTKSQPRVFTVLKFNNNVSPKFSCTLSLIRDTNRVYVRSYLLTDLWSEHTGSRCTGVWPSCLPRAGGVVLASVRCDFCRASSPTCCRKLERTTSTSPEASPCIFSCRFPHPLPNTSISFQLHISSFFFHLVEEKF